DPTSAASPRNPWTIPEAALADIPDPQHHELTRIEHAALASMIVGPTCSGHTTIDITKPSLPNPRQVHAVSIGTPRRDDLGFSSNRMAMPRL
ncbi:hypothetical protein, partial [Rhodococcus sp. BH5]|uniref:hypothetical protein n=1 Tax=Rhodococcus sp. BH5 TaxID=2871702 RepID=UPI0022CD75F2